MVDTFAEARLGPEHLALTMASMGDLTSSRAFGEVVYEGLRRLLPPGHHHRLISCANLAITLYEMGEATEARVLWRRLCKDMQARVLDSLALGPILAEAAELRSTQGDLAASSGHSRMSLDELTIRTPSGRPSGPCAKRATHPLIGPAWFSPAILTNRASSIQGSQVSVHALVKLNPSPEQKLAGSRNQYW